MDIRKIIREELDSGWGWAEEVPAIYIPKVGDRVKCLPGFINDENGYPPHNPEYGELEIDDPKYGGAGYDDGMVFTINSIIGLVDGRWYKKEEWLEGDATMDSRYISKKSGREAWIIWPEGSDKGVWSDAVTPLGDNINESEEDWDFTSFYNIKPEEVLQTALDEIHPGRYYVMGDMAISDTYRIYIGLNTGDEPGNEVNWVYNFNFLGKLDGEIDLGHFLRWLTQEIGSKIALTTYKPNTVGARKIQWLRELREDFKEIIKKL
jgi:hypothetical protein